MNKQQILTNLNSARAVLEGVPEDKLDLLFFFKNDDVCGTLACAAGWLALSPAFSAIMGLTVANPDQTVHRHVLVPAGETLPRYDHKGGYAFDWLDEHFGPDAFAKLFESRGGGAQ